MTTVTTIDETLYAIILNQDFVIRELSEGKLIRNVDEIIEYTNEVLNEQEDGNSELFELVGKQKEIIIKLDECLDECDIDSFLEKSEDIIEKFDYLS